MSEIDPNTQVSHEQDGRILTGVGVSVDSLAETMDRHAPPEAKTPAGTEAASTAATEGGAEPPAPPSRGRQRFADLTREREEARAEATKERTERERLAKEYEDFKAKASQPAPKAEPEPAAKTAPEQTRPEPTEDEIGTKYETYAAFARDLAKWVVEQERAAFDPAATVREILASEREAQRFRSTVVESQDRGRKAYADFDTLLKTSPSATIAMAPVREEALERLSFIANHPQSEHIQYAILKDPALAQKLHESNAMQFGVLIAGIATPPDAPVKATWKPPPPPYPTVGASSPTVAKSSGELAKGTDFDASGYREKRAEERGVKGRR